MASITKRGNTWSVRYNVRDAFGKIIKYERKSGFRTKEDAMAAARELERASAHGVDVHGDALTCGELMEKWFDTKASEVHATTLAKYSLQIDRLKDHSIYTTQVRYLRKDLLGVLIDQLKQGDSTHAAVALVTAVDYTDPLRFSLRWAASEGLLLHNPLDGARLPRLPGSRQVILSESDVDDLITECKTHNPYFLVPLYLALYGGLCREEAAGLKWEDVNVVAGTVRIKSVLTAIVSGGTVTKEPKNRYRARTVVLPRFVMDYLAAQPHVSDYVCVSQRGTPYTLGMYSHTVGRLISYINKRRSAQHNTCMPHACYHDLRHTHAAMCIAMGIQPKVISERLGHSSIKITMDVYGYLMPGLQQQVADAFDQRRA